MPSNFSGIFVSHNAEIAHRLSLLPGKCQQIHGHSLQIELTLSGEINDKGILEGRDFGSVKKEFRAYIDSEYDHHLLLNQDDPLLDNTCDEDIYPGLHTCPGDPTIENIATWIWKWSEHTFGLYAMVKVLETNTNGAVVGR